MNLIVDCNTMKVEGLTRISTENYRELVDLVRARLPKLANLIEVNLSRVSLIDSQGLSALIALRKMIQATGGRIVLVQPTQMVEQILMMTKVHHIFEVESCAQQGVLSSS